LTISGRTGGLAACAATALLLAGCAKAPERLDALLAPLRTGYAPGAAVLVIRGRAVVYSAALGLADVERRIPIGPRTAFDIASVSKQFTAALAMMLHEEGRLDYDAPVVRFLPELSRFGDRMTVRHLLTHTSGLPDYYEALARSRGDGGWVSNREALDYLARQGAPVFPPGDRFQYSDAGYEMLALVLEKVAGEPFGGLLRRRIFEPLGMNDTRLRDRPDVVVPNRARGYTLRREGFVAEGRHPMDCLVGSGAINTTIDDLFRWDQALASERLVRRATFEEALRPMRLNDGTDSDYGFGWFLREDHGHRRLEHPGSWQGFQAFIARYPDDRFTVVLLANRSDLNLGDLADRIVRIYASSDGTPY
jgi:CubicO group peptidase (beta-lactamase class C family)